MQMFLAPDLIGQKMGALKYSSRFAVADIENCIFKEVSKSPCPPFRFQQLLSE